MNRYEGKDNCERPKSKYTQELSLMNNKKLESECYSMIYQSARCANNSRADWHWMVDACYDEALKRDPEASIYNKAFKECYKDHAEK